MKKLNQQLELARIMSDTEHDIIQKYNKNIVFQTLKEGRLIKRKGLGARLLLLSGSKMRIGADVKNANLTNNSDYYDKQICFYPGMYSFENLQRVLFCESTQNILAKYLGKTLTKISYRHRVIVYYQSTHEIPWGLLDSHLLAMYPRNCYKTKRGFIMYKYR